MYRRYLMTVMNRFGASWHMQQSIPRKDHGLRAYQIQLVQEFVTVSIFELLNSLKKIPYFRPKFYSLMRPISNKQNRLLWAEAQPGFLWFIGW